MRSTGPSNSGPGGGCSAAGGEPTASARVRTRTPGPAPPHTRPRCSLVAGPGPAVGAEQQFRVDRKSTRLNSSHSQISYAVFCLKKKNSAMAQPGNGLLEGTFHAGTSAVTDKLLDLFELGSQSAADKGKDTRHYLAAAFTELNACDSDGADAFSAGIVDT